MPAPTLNGALAANPVAADAATTDGTPVASLTDRVGGTWSQATAAKRPTYVASAIGGKPGMNFDGTDDALLGDATIRTVLDNAPGTTIFVVAATSTTAVGPRAAIAVSNGATTFRTRAGLGRSATADGMQVSGRRLDADGIIRLEAPTAPVLNAGEVWTGSLDTPNATASIYRNGTLEASGPFQTAGSFSATTSLAVALGSLGNGTEEFWSGLIAEVMIYDRVLTESERGQVHAYVRDEYGIVVSDAPPPPPPPPPPLVVYDGFDTTTTDAGKWPELVQASAQSQPGGVLRMFYRPNGNAGGTGYTSRRSPVVVNLTGSEVRLRVSATHVGSGGANRESGMTLTDPAGKFLSLFATGAADRALLYDWGTKSTTVVQSVTDPHWRIREAGGDLFWDTSADGETWTNRRTVAGGAVNLDVTRLTITLFAGYWSTDNATNNSNSYIDVDAVEAGSLSSAPDPTVSITGGTGVRTVRPGDVVTVAATSNQAAIAWTVSGADFTSTGSSITFTAPVAVSGAAVAITATATNADGLSVSQSLTVNVRPVTLALVAGGVTGPRLLDYVAQLVGSGPETFTLGTTEPTPDNTWLGLAPLQTIAGDFTPTSNTTYTRVQFTGRIIWNSTLTGVTFDDCDFAPTGSPTTDSAVVNMELATSVAMFNRCRIRPQAPSGYWHSIRGRFYRMWRCLILDCVDGPGTNVTQPNADAEPRIEGTCVQDLFYGPANYQNDGVSHADAAQLQAARMYLDGCRLWANVSPKSTLTSPYGASVPGQAVAVTPNVSPVGLTLRRSWLKYGAQSLTMIPGSQGLVAGGGLIELNRWDTRTNPALRRGGPSGPTARRAVLIDPTLTVTGMPATTGPDTVHGNVDYDGSPLIVHRVTSAS